MKINQLKIKANCLAYCRVTGVYLDSEVFKLVESVLCQTNVESEDFRAWTSFLMNEIHNAFRQRGNKESLANQHGKSAHGWYQSGCELVLIEIDGGQVKYCQVGTIHVVIKGSDALSLAVPVHNIAQETKSGTIEDSLLGSLSGRSQEAIAEQLLYSSPEMVPHLADMPQQDFIRTIGHYKTRILGFYPQVTGKSVTYSNEFPIATHGEFELRDGDSLHVFFPSVMDTMQYDESKLLASCEKLMASNIEPHQAGEWVDDPACMQVAIPIST